MNTFAMPVVAGHGSQGAVGCAIAEFLERCRDNLRDIREPAIRPHIPAGSPTVMTVVRICARSQFLESSMQPPWFLDFGEFVTPNVGREAGVTVSNYLDTAPDGQLNEGRTVLKKVSAQDNYGLMLEMISSLGRGDAADRVVEAGRA
ncbi:hypothetical protein ACFTZB_33750, partial [Rhodococcus sp. NPDC057014]|uniref:hypothetical protein n=1 Tax=Rhodococcus sp. NPDC057014 TaxID=3346000 RepID=UPI00363C9439